MPGLKALSIQQPWLDLIVRGHKTLEVRSWELWNVGTYALHASRSVDFPAAHLFGYQEPWLLPRGGIVALAELTKVVELDPERGLATVEQHLQALPIGVHMFGFQIRNVRPLQSTVRARGQPQPFLLPRAIEREVLRQI